MDDKIFEQEVRRVARELWPSAALGGATKVDGRERDGLFETSEIIYILEATTSRKKDKVEYDAKKTAEVVKSLRRGSGKFAKGFVITLEDPTADQRTAAKPYEKQVEVMSYEQFCSKLISGSTYLSLRDKAPFGSVQDTYVDREIPRTEFIEPTLDDGQEERRFSSIYSATKNGERFCIIAEFGSGKSMTLREIYYRLRDDFLSKHSLRFPVYINLRDHSGAEYVEEILERHGRKLGYPDPGSLVRAWRAGFLHLLLDGFDEMIGRGISPSPTDMRDYRRRIMRAVNALIAESPAGTGIVICGRSGFFDTPAEREQTLGLRRGFSTVFVRPFDEDQTNKLMRARRVSAKLPAWLPRRPLLLTFLISRGYLSASEGLVSGDASRGSAWIELLDMICTREAEQCLSLDPVSTKTFFERLATRSRYVAEGVATLNSAAIASVFRTVAKREPLEDDWQLILRLPGLAPAQGGESGRVFIDEDLCGAAAAGDLARFVMVPYNAEDNDHLKDLGAPLSELGHEVLSHYLESASRLTDGALSFSLDTASKQKLHQVAADLFISLSLNGFSYSGSGADIVDGHVDELDLSISSTNSPKISFYSCVIRSTFLPIGADPSRIPVFRECWFGNLVGRSGESDLPQNRFYDCLFDTITLSQNAGIANGAEYPVALKALIASLERLFFQAGSGRLESAFVRGLDERASLLIPDVLKLIYSHKFASPTRVRGRTIWIPNREQTARAGKIVKQPSISRDPIVLECLEIR
jgi:hypothetical protein